MRTATGRHRFTWDFWGRGDREEPDQDNQAGDPECYDPFTMATTTVGTGIRAALALPWIGAGLILNPWYVASQYAADGKITNELYVALIVGFDLVLIGWGVTLCLLRDKPIVWKVNLPLLSLAIGIPLAAEATLRLGIRFGLPQLRSPGLYAAYWVDDDFWKLHHRWNVAPLTRPESIHPLLGWSQGAVTRDNPLGLEPDTLRMLVPDGRNKILFYGDSFVKGEADPPYYLPRYINERTPDADVIDLGVGGFGTDQIYLLFKETVSKVDRGAVIMGVLLNDLDRAVLTVRTAQKPYFTIDDRGELTLRGTPVFTDRDEFYRRNPPSFSSYALKLVQRWLGHRPYSADDVKRLNSAIIRDVESQARQHDRKLIYVIFYPYGYLEATDWRESYLKEELARRGLDYVDTKVPLLRHAEEKGIPPTEFYGPGQHHNNLGNEIIAEAILDYLRSIDIGPRPELLEQPRERRSMDRGR